jgi:hypothetical protein
MGLSEKLNTTNKSLAEVLAEFEKQKHPDKSIVEIMVESYEREHSDFVISAKENYDEWIELIIWDLLEIQDSYKNWNEANDLDKYHLYLTLNCRSFGFLHEDIELLNIKNERKNIKIANVSKSNWHLVKLFGYLEETNVILSKQLLGTQLQQNFALIIDKIKTVVNNFIANTNAKNIKDFIWAEETWSKLPQMGKNQILYELEDIVGEEGLDKECLKA